MEAHHAISHIPWWAHDPKSRNDPDVRERVIEEHKNLIRYVVNRVAARLPAHLDPDDLYSAGVIGLIDAILKYDPEKNLRFSTYAEFRIKGAVLDTLRDLDFLPRGVRRRQKQFERAVWEIEQRLGRRARSDEIADAMGVTLERLHIFVDAYMTSFSNFSDLVRENNENAFHEDDLADPSSVDPHRVLELDEFRSSFSDYLLELPERERAIFLLYHYKDLTFKEIGRRFNLCGSRINQLHTKAIVYLRRKLLRAGH